MTGTAGGVAVEVLRARTPSFTREPRWISGPNDPIGIEDVKLLTLRPRTAGLVIATQVDETTLDWSTVASY